jgi:hypothetical protein
VLETVVGSFGFMVTIKIRLLSAFSDLQGQEAENILRFKIMCSCSKSDGICFSTASALFWIGSYWFSLSLTPLHRGVWDLAKDAIPMPESSRAS